MIFRFTLLGILFISNFALAQSLQITSQSLRDFVESRNVKVKAKEFEKQSAESREGSFGRSFLPSIELYGSQETFQKGSQEKKTQPTYGAEVKVNLFNGGKDWLRESKRSLTSQRKVIERSVTVAEQITEAHTVYWNILFLRDSLKIIKEAKEINSNNLNSASRRIRSGVATETDRIEFEMKSVDLRQQEDFTTLKYKAQVNHLKLLLGIEDSAEVAFPEELRHEHDWQGMVKHTEQDHDFLVKTFELLSQELEIEGTELKRSYWPRLDVFAAWNQYNQREEDFVDAADRKESVVGIKLSLSLFDGLSAYREGNALNAQSKAAALEANYRKREIENHLHDEMAELKLLHEQVHDAEENIKRSEKYYRSTLSEYSRGVKNSPDVLSASEKIYAMKVKRIDIVHQFQISKFHLLAKLGK